MSLFCFCILELLILLWHTKQRPYFFICLFLLIFLSRTLENANCFTSLYSETVLASSSKLIGLTLVCLNNKGSRYISVQFNLIQSFLNRYTFIDHLIHDTHHVVEIKDIFYFIENVRIKVMFELFCKCKYIRVQMIKL